MNAILTLSVALALVAAASAAPAATVAAPEPLVARDSVAVPAVPYEWSATYASMYSFQGHDYSEGLPVLQPEVSASWHALSLGVWGNLDQARREVNEYDVTLQAEHEYGPVTGTVGYAYLHYPHRDWEATHELLGELGVSGPVDASLNVHWDVAAGQGGYWTLGVSRDATVHGAVGTLGAKLYVEEHYYGQTGIPAIETSLAIKSPWAGLALQPSISRLWTWPNGSFRGDEAIRSRWLLSLTFSQ